MTSAQIRAKIRYYENLIDQYQSEKSKLEDDLYELEYLKTKVVNLQTNFGNRQQQRKQNLAVLEGVPQRNKIYSVYCSGMRELLSGQEFSRSYSGLTTATEKVSKKVKGVSQQIETYKNKITSAQSQKEYWQRQLKIALLEEAKKEKG